MIITKVKEKLEKSDILKLYQKGYKTIENYALGIEYERLPISSSSYKAISYDSENGICNFLRQFAKEENWDYITDDYNIIGLKQEHDTITLEPGCQIELSIKPERNIFDIEKKIKSLNKKMHNLLDKSNITLLEYGVSPFVTHKNINIIPKKRYNICGEFYLTL